MLNYITSYLSSDTTPGQAGNVFWALVYILVVFGGISVAVMAMNWLERKALAHFQIRLGPMRVGPHGLLQPIADAIKLMTKEDIIPAEADKFVFWIAPLIILCASFAVYIVIPFGPTHAITDLNIGILFMLGVSSLSVLGVVMAGWASNSHYPLIGALRSSAQMVSYEIAMGMAVVSAVLMTSLHGLGPYGVGVGTSGTGTLSMIGIVQAQQEQHVWFLFKFFPLGFVAFGIFAIAMVAETNRAPFDLPEAESELTAGFHTEYSGDFVARWMVPSIPQYIDRRDLGPGVLARSGIEFSGAGSHCFRRRASHAQASLFSSADHRPGRIRRRAGFDRPDLVCASGARPYSGHLLVRG
jgi:NADH-quinone oxidoreductase subunit H